MTDATGKFAAPELPALARRSTWAYWVALAALLVLAAALDLAGLGARFDLQSYDEGVYWETLRSMEHGFSLYDPIFVSQPPLFPLTLYPFYHLFGSTIAAARLTLVAFSLLGLVAAWLSGLLLAGRPGGLLAHLLTASSTLQFTVPRHLEAEGPAEALLFLALALALRWWRKPGGRTSLLALAASGVCVTAGTLIKLLDVTGYAVLGLMLATAGVRALMRREPLLPIVGAGVAIAVASLATALLVLLPLAPAWPELYRQVGQVHRDARIAYGGQFGTNARNLWSQFLLPNAALCVLALAGLITAAWQRDLRAVFLAGWLIVSALLLLQQMPLFGRHAIILLLPLVALAMLAVDHASRWTPRWSNRRALPWGMGATAAMVAVAAIGGFAGQAAFLQGETDISTRDGPVLAALAADIAANVQPGQWVVTDQQLASAGADRDTPPGLVDTSWVRIDSGYLSAGELCAATADSRVAAVLFGTARLSSKGVAGFKSCVERDFDLYRDYGYGTTLWLRRPS